MRISDWSSDVCSSDLRRRQSCVGHQRQFTEVRSAVQRAGVARVGTAGDQYAGVLHGLQVLPGHGRHPGLLALFRGLLDEIRQQVRRDPAQVVERVDGIGRSEEHTSELQSLMRISYAVFCLNKKNKY